MKKVICVRGMKKPSGQDRQGNWFEIPAAAIYEGETYTVLNEVKGFFDESICYVLVEKGEDYQYKSKYFMPLSDIDETELIKDREQVIVKIS